MPTSRNRNMIRSRLVLNFPGFEKTDAAHQLDRIAHGATKTGQVWGFESVRNPNQPAAGAFHATSQWQTAGKNWKTETRLIQFAWHDIIAIYENAPHPRAFFANFPKFLAFFVDGTAGRYFRHAKRYWGFTIFPLLLIGLFAAITLIGSLFLLAWLGLAGIGKWIAALALASIATLLLCKWPGERYYLLLTVNDWGFARDMVNRSNPLIEKRYEEFADVLAAEIARSNHDEIVIAGHSFGAVWAVAALALALERHPGLLAGRNVVFLALGSSLLKIAFAPKAQFMRDWAARIMAELDIFWHEIQTKDDLIAFYKADPFAALGIANLQAQLKIDRVRYGDAMERKRYRAMRKSFYRTHRQYILYQDRRVAFDSLLRMFGPFGARQLAQHPEAIARMDATGRLDDGPKDRSR
jgi:hypothetical protein